MDKLLNFHPGHKSFSWILSIIVLLTLLQQSCRKQDFQVTTPSQDLAKNFFTPTIRVNKKTLDYITVLKEENDRRNFVDALPHNIGRPLWEKLGARTITSRLARGDSGTHFLVIPFAPSSAYLAGLLIAVPSDTGYITTYYSTGYLKSLCYDPGKDVEQVENLLGLFMMMENYVFKRESFYHVPRDLFSNNALVLLSDSTKMASMADLSAHIQIPANIHSPLPPDLPCYNVPSGGHHPMEEGPCDWREGCGYCSALYCGSNFPHLPGPPSGPGGSPPTTPMPIPGGGGTGGGNPPPPAPVPCDAPFYLVNPCAPLPGPLPPEETPYFTLVDVDADSVNNPCINALIEQLGMPGFTSYLLGFYQNPSLPTPHNDRIKIVFLEDTTLAATNGSLVPGRTHLNILQDSTREIKITLNPKCMQSYAKEFIATVILHELAHGIYSILDRNSTEQQQHLLILSKGAGIIGRAVQELFPGMSTLNAISLGLSGLDNIILIPDGQGGLKIDPAMSEIAERFFGIPLEVARPIGLSYLNGITGTPC